MKWALVPEKPGRISIPVILLSFFNPESKQYMTLESQAHTLSVAPLDHAVTLEGPLTVVESVVSIGLTVADVTVGVTLDGGLSLATTHVLVVQSMLLAVSLASAEQVAWSLWAGSVEVAVTLQGVWDGSVVQPYTSVEVAS